MCTGAAMMVKIYHIGRRHDRDLIQFLAKYSARHYYSGSHWKTLCLLWFDLYEIVWFRQLIFVWLLISVAGIINWGESTIDTRFTLRLATHLESYRGVFSCPLAFIRCRSVGQSVSPSMCNIVFYWIFVGVVEDINQTAWYLSIFT